jgi:GNAT superfamily N-acetyltransferase
MIEIRKATLEDEGQVFQLLKVLFSSSLPEDGVRDWQNAANQYRKIIREDTQGTILVAEEGGGLLGVITLSYPQAIRCGGIFASIEEFVVSEKARGKGIGGRLLEAAIAEATARGCDEIDVNRPSASGYPLYTKHGIKDLGKNLMTKLPRPTD